MILTRHDVVEMLERGETVQQSAARLGASERDVERARRKFLRRARGPSRLIRAAMVASFAAALFVARNGLAGTCATLLPSPLITMCPDEPALASELNGNFNNLAQALINRTGALDPLTSTPSPNITQASGGQLRAADGTIDVHSNVTVANPRHVSNNGTTEVNGAALFTANLTLIGNHVFNATASTQFQGSNQLNHANVNFPAGANLTALRTDDCVDLQATPVPNLPGWSTAACPAGLYENGVRTLASGGFFYGLIIRCCRP
jgi:hypothetical protein